MKALVKKTLAYLAARTCLTFVENAAAANRIRVFSGSGCYSNEGSRYNYNKLTTGESVNYTPYEYGSVMHYDAQSFASSGNSMKPKNARYLRTMGSHMISFYDISIINTHYKCNAVCATKGAKCVNGGKRNPKNCNACICPAGYGGALCSLRPAGCGAVLTAAATWKSKKVVLGNATNFVRRDTYTMCNDWIKAPAGKKVQVQVTVMKGVLCYNGCWTHGIEFKTLPDKLTTNPRACCEGQLKQVITSNINPTPVINYNSYQQSEITYLYKYI
nr:Peptidase M12A domain containing protein [Haemonchus contortus]